MHRILASASARFVHLRGGMFKGSCRAIWILTLAILTGAARAGAQTPPTSPPTNPPPPPPWTGSVGLGLSLSRGNTAASNLNASFEATHGAKTDTVWKFKGLYLRGDDDGVASVDSLSLEMRHERTFNKRWYGFGNLQYLRDTFKDIDYLVAPSAGIGYKVIATPATTFNVDGGFGVKVEKNPGLDQRVDPVVTASDRFEHKLSATATLTQNFGALWKAQDFGDALYTFGAGVAASITTRTQLKIELLDTYASRPPSAGIKSNDVTLLTAFVYKF
jgi:putative salt-induced outer membrane protein